MSGAAARLVCDERPETSWEFDVLRTWTERLRGLLGTESDARPVLITRCGSVHTVGMAYALDLAFLSERGEVLEVQRGIGPGHFASCVGASCTLERPASEGEWVQRGEHLWVASVSVGLVGS